MISNKPRVLLLFSLAALGLTLQARAAGGELVLTIDTGRQQARRPVSIPAGAWTRCRVPLRELGLADSDVGLIQSVGFVNERPTTQRMLIDEFLIRRD